MSRKSIPDGAAENRRRRTRCAIYTRKSSDEGLEQSFNSLDAQREACEAYIKSQAHEGWIAVPTHYDDGGFSGGSMERPALKALLSDIAAGKVDVICVYKIDRLTRSLGDFGRIVEVFDKAGASFVSITQSFNTTSSMGRLTLNVLLSFAQFEREVTGERIRDKIAQSKAKGMWMGGNVVIGYDLKDRALVINPGEAATVRLIFQRYLELGSVHRLRDELEAQGIRSKLWTSLRRQVLGGQIFSRGALYHLLQNPHFIGRIVHGKLTYPGLHPPIIEQDLFDRVQALLALNRRRQKNRKPAPRDPAAVFHLVGRLFDGEGDPMSPNTSHGHKGQRYRYYVSSALQSGGAPAGSPSLGPRRLSASLVDAFMLQELRRLSEQPAAEWAALSPLLLRVETRAGSTELVLDEKALAGKDHLGLSLTALCRRLGVGEEAVKETGVRSAIRVRLPRSLQFRGGRRGCIKGEALTIAGATDPVLIKALRDAHAVLRSNHASPLMRASELLTATSPQTAYQRRLCRLALLAPDLQLAILDGRHPQALTLADFIDSEVPLGFEAQRRWWRSLR